MLSSFHNTNYSFKATLVLLQIHSGLAVLLLAVLCPILEDHLETGMSP